MNVEETSLTWVFELRFVFVSVNVAVVSGQGMPGFKLVWTFLTEPVGLSGVSADAHVGVESSPPSYEFENVSLLY